jgi:hypothetical protein
MTYQPSLLDALAARDEGIAQVEAASDEIARNAIDQAIAHFAATGAPFSANDTRPLLPDVRAPLIGARFQAAARAGLIRRVGFTQSTEPATHAAWVKVWQGAA